jgi:hypothetical protein
MGQALHSIAHLQSNRLTFYPQIHRIIGNGKIAIHRIGLLGGTLRGANAPYKSGDRTGGTFSGNVQRQ